MTHGVLVVGGGVSGLAAAYDLVAAGLPVSVCESSDRWGGKVRTDDVDGFLIEAGPDSFVSYRPAAAQLASEVGLGDDVIGTSEPRQVWLRREGRMVPMPDQMGLVLPTRLGPLARTSLFTWPQKMRAGLDVLLPRQLTAADVAVGPFLRRRLGDALVTRLADPLFGGIYGTSVDELSLDAVLPQLRAAEKQHRSLLVASLAQGRSARRSAGRGAQRAPSSPFRTLRRGMGSLVDGLVGWLADREGVDLRPATAVTGLSLDGTVTSARFCDGTTRRFDAVVLAAPGRSTAALLADELPLGAETIGSVRHASTAVVSLGYAEDAFVQPLGGHGFLEAGPGPAVFSGCTFSSLKWPDRAPSGTVLLRAFVPDRSAALLTGSDADVADVVEREVGGVLAIRRRPLLRRVSRWTKAMPVYTVGHLDRMAALDEAMQARPTWVLAGATYRGVGVPDCVASGRRAASQVADVLAGRCG